MKHIIITILIFILTTLNCKAQSPIFPLDDWDYEQENAYYKDFNNDLNPFQGTWLYTNGNTSLKIVLEKRLMQYNGEYYTDLIVGEYQYIENGVEKINTLNQLSQDLGENHNVEGNFLRYNCKYYVVDDCVDGEISLRLFINDPLNDSGVNIVLHKRTISGQQQALKANMWYGGGLLTAEEIIEPTLGFQSHNIVFLKQ